MAFDPSKPVEGSEIDAVELRAQFNALHDENVALAAQVTAQGAQIAALQTALAGTALNPNVGTFSTSMSDPPSRDSVQAILDVLNALITQLTRV